MTAYQQEIAFRKAGGFRIVVTGDKEIDAALRKLGKEGRKVVLKASKVAAQKALKDYKRLVPVKSGALRDAAKVRRMKITRSNKGGIGHSIWFDRNKLFKKYQKFYGRLPGKRTKDSEPFFYPTVIEFGDQDTPAQKPLRRAVYGNQEAIKELFLNELRQLLRTFDGGSTGLPSGGGKP